MKGHSSRCEPRFLGLNRGSVHRVVPGTRAAPLLPEKGRGSILSAQPAINSEVEPRFQPHAQKFWGGSLDRPVTHARQLGSVLRRVIGVRAMRARVPSENATFGPEQLSTLYQAFDDAWEVLKCQYAGNEQSTEVGRLRLANAVISEYRDGVTDPAALTSAAVQMMGRWA